MSIKENTPHIAVLPQEVIEAFKNIKDGYIVDCTLGYGSHTLSLLQSLPNIKMICIDQDDMAIQYCKNKLASFEDRIIYIKSNFSNTKEIFNKYPIKGILADIGVSSLQLDDKNRGFGFDSDVLDMRMDTKSSFSAYDVVNNYSKEELENIFLNLGEVRAYKKVAQLIYDNRRIEPIKSALRLSEILYASMRPMKKGMHPATLVFQAIRIEVNKELEVLSTLLNNIQESNFKNTIISIISFHSLEDRIVKNYFKKWKTSCICDSNDMKCTCGNNNQKGIVITKKPITPTKEEIKSNNRSRSSKMRIFHFTTKTKKYQK